MTICSRVRHAWQVDRQCRVGHWKPSRTNRLQRQRLRKLLWWAKQHSAYFSGRLSGVDVDNADLLQIPPTTAKETQSCLPHMITDPHCKLADALEFEQDPANAGKWFRNKYVILPNGSTQDSTDVAILDRHSIEIFFAIADHRISSASPRWRPSRLGQNAFSPRVAVVQLPNENNPCSPILKYMDDAVGHRIELKNWVMDGRMDGQSMNRFDPSVLVGSSSALEALAQRAYRGKWSGLRSIWSFSGPLSTATRAKLEVTFDAPVVPHYGIPHCPFLADGCSAGCNLHVNADWVILEVVDDSYEPVLPGTTGSRILITNLANRVLPIIRYEVTDWISPVNYLCACGSKMPIIHRSSVGSPPASGFARWLDEYAPYPAQHEHP